MFAWGVVQQRKVIKRQVHAKTTAQSKGTAWTVDWSAKVVDKAVPDTICCDHYSVVLCRHAYSPEQLEYHYTKNKDVLRRAVATLRQQQQQGPDPHPDDAAATAEVSPDAQSGQ